MTTYHPLVLVRDSEEGTLWRYLGPIEARSGESAKKAALARENIDTAPIVAVPDRSWDPEVFTRKAQPAQYVKGVTAAQTG